MEPCLFERVGPGHSSLILSLLEGGVGLVLAP